MKILIIDDDHMLREPLAMYLEDMDYDCLQASNGQEGLDMLDAQAEADNLPDVVIVDLNMPVLDGYGFIEGAIQRNDNIPIIVLSGVGVLEDALRAMRLGAWDFITKPIADFRLLEHALDKATEKARLIKENRDYQHNLEQLVQERTQELENARHQIMQRLCRAAEYKDNETGKHVIRVGEISATLARAMGLSDKLCDMMRECAALHDVGKIGIPDEILLKPGKLTPEEWEIMKTHCAVGCVILGQLEDKAKAERACALVYDANIDDNECELIRLARMLAMLHHEKWDGSGYPMGLQGDDIPLEARIVSLVDVFDAVLSKRPYKKAFSLEQCLDIIRSGSGSHFDPAIVDAFFNKLDEILAIQEKWKD